jgi:ribosome biogenesis GTPase
VTLDEQLYMQHVYQQIGYTCLRVSSTEAKGIDKLKELMLDKVSMFSGHSGVGKSTLVNALATYYIKTKTTRLANKASIPPLLEMYDLSFGARIVDTPGIKGFGVVDMEPAEISGYFFLNFQIKRSVQI